MLESHITDITRVIQLAIAPVFLLSAVATLITALNTRLGRIVDRRRVVQDALRNLQAGGAPELDAELHLLFRRVRLIYASIFSAVSAALFVCLVVALAFIDALSAFDLAREVAVMFILAMFGLCLCLTLLMREIYLAVTDTSHQLLRRSLRPPAA